MPAAPTDLFGKRGEVLFHYTTLARAVEDILPAMRMKLSPFADMRDPRESKDWGVTASGFGDNPDSGGRRYWELHRELNGLKRSCRLLALTQDDPDSPTSDDYGRGFARPRLWEQYGGAHTGICLSFDRDALIGSMDAAFSGELFFRHGAVDYRDERLFRELIFDSAVLAEGVDLPSVVTDHLEKHWQSLFFTKLTDWASEHEYRFLVRRADFDPMYVDISDSLRSICMGPETSSSYFPSLAAFCEPHSISIRRLVWRNNEPLTWAIQIQSPAATTQE
jgi:hypothetical protein